MNGSIPAGFTQQPLVIMKGAEGCISQSSDVPNLPGSDLLPLPKLISVQAFFI